MIRNGIPVINGQKQRWKNENRNCILKAWCRGCPAVASRAHGDFYDADPQCWKEVPGYEGSRSSWCDTCRAGYKLKPCIGASYGFGNIREACMVLDGGKVNGKIVVEVAVWDFGKFRQRI